MQRTVWEIGIGVALLLLVGMSVDCVLQTGGLPGPTPQPNSYTCICDCGSDPPTSLNVCVPPGMNATPDAISKDCSTRVQPTFQAMKNDCSVFGGPITCQCTVQGTAQAATGCDKPCDKVPIKADCTNFDPQDIPGPPGSATATVPKDPTRGAGPVCTVPPGQ